MIMYMFYYICTYPFPTTHFDVFLGNDQYFHKLLDFLVVNKRKLKINVVFE